MRNQIYKYSDNIREAESHFLPSNYLNGKYNMSRTGTKTLSLTEEDGILYDYPYERYFPYETRGDQA